MPAVKWSIGRDIEQVRILTKDLVEKLRKQRSDGAMSVGVSVLANVQRAYRDKARGGMGSDGEVWRDLSSKTLEARVRRRAPARKIVEQRRQIAQEIQGILSGGVTPRSRRGKKKEVSKRAAVKNLRQIRKDLSRKLDNLVITEHSSYEIGVDTGLQINSASPGFTDPNSVWHRDPIDSLGANLFSVNAGNVAIAYDRSYSAAFDAERKLIPKTLPDPWRIEAEGQFVKWADLVINAGDN